ncbi:MAG: DNA-directed RNA polymerase subunit omega [Lachnospiraceae bacterium]|nr:DNA-directed RNA polymerase subunit omega [Lachnospiraceae bacterium]
MLRPSYTDLLEVLENSGVNEDIAASRYTIVIAAAKRARQLTEENKPLCEVEVDKPVSIAVKELYESKIKIVALEETEELCEEEAEELAEAEETEVVEEASEEE